MYSRGFEIRKKPDGCLYFYGFCWHPVTRILSLLRYQKGGWSYHEGDLSDSRMLEAARKRGVHLTSRSRPLLPEDFQKFDYIVGEPICQLCIALAQCLPLCEAQWTERPTHPGRGHQSSHMRRVRRQPANICTS